MAGCSAEGSGSEAPDFDFEIRVAPASFGAPGAEITLTYVFTNASMPLQVTVTSETESLDCGPVDVPAGSGETTCVRSYSTTSQDVVAGQWNHSIRAEGVSPNFQDASVQTAEVEVLFVFEESAVLMNPSNWPIFSVACNEDTAQMEVLIDTGYDWLTAQTRVVFSAVDGQTTYTCDVPDLPGRVCCTGSQSASPGALTFCILREGDPTPVCHTYSDFPEWLTGLSCEPDGR